MKTNPVFATIIGFHKYDDKLPELSVEDSKEDLKRQKEFLERLRQIDRSNLPEQEKLSYDIFEHLRNRRINEIEQHSYLIPITSISGFYTGIPRLTTLMPFETVAHYENYISRLNETEGFVREHIAIMKKGLEEGYSLPKVVADNVPPMVKAQIVDSATNSTLYKPFESFPDGIDKAQQLQLRKEGKAAIDTSVVPGFEAFHEFMVNKYIPNARDTIAATALPNGEKYYRQKIRYYTSLDLSAREIHETGKKEVQKIRDEMMSIAEEKGYESLDKFIEFLRNDPQFYASSKQELLEHTSYILKRIDGKLPGYFEMLPRTPYGIREIPDFQAKKAPIGYYIPPPNEGNRAGYFYINTHDIESRPLYELTALALHEAVPGHHLQLALAQELENLPKFRRNAFFNSYSEGWALYSEWLGKEMGIYQDAYSDFGRLSAEMTRAVRLVVDTGMHAMGWSRQQAIDYMARHTANSMTNVKNEIDRYISMPGQALGYKIGELKIHSLRDTTEKALGDQFNLRAFHQLILENGALPLPVLEKQVEQYISDRNS